MEKETMNWLQLNLKRKDLKHFFTQNGIKSIAIYGCSYFGDAFYEDIQNYGIDVKFFIDKEIMQFHGITVLHPSQISAVNGIDLVVICVREPLTREIFHILHKADLPCISLLQIIMISYYKEILIPYNNHCGLSTYILSLPCYDQLQNLSLFEKAISSIRRPDITKYFTENPEYFTALYDSVNEYDDEYIRNVFTVSPTIMKNNMLIHSDMHSKYVNIIQGMRLTDQTPDSFNKTIHILGQCVGFGYGVDDSRTISSYLQRMLNKISIDCNHIRVINHGVFGFPSHNPHMFLNKIKTLSFNRGDIVVLPFDRFEIYSPFIMKCFFNVLNTSKNIYFDVFDDFCLPKKHPLYIDYTHLSHYGMERVAKYLFKTLIEENALFTQDNTDSDFSHSTINRTEIKNNYSQINPTIITDTDSSSNLKGGGSLDEYILYLQSHKINNNYFNGAIVMNCNPFTNGHKYLIEMASKNVDHLYLFVVEEDRSFFPFKDRLMLVTIGTADLKNVTVLQSGKYILSAVTFPEYFVKDSLSKITIDTSVDIEIFAQKIAPVLGIKKRFVGEEPLDPITKQYNQAMKDILPKYNIELVEYCRHHANETPISASRVRKLLELKQWDEISKLVPKTTFQYLLEKGIIDSHNN